MEDFVVDAYDLRVSLGVSAYVLPPEADDEIEQWRAELFWRPDGQETERRVAVADFLVVHEDVGEPALRARRDLGREVGGEGVVPVAVPVVAGEG